MRTTKKQVERKFEIFLDLIGAEKAKSYNDVGAYDIDHNTVYGGYLIERVENMSGGISHPFGSARRGASEMWYTLDFACSVLYELKKGGK